MYIKYEYIQEIPISEEILSNGKLSEIVLKVPRITQDLLNQVKFIQDFQDGGSDYDKNGSLAKGMCQKHPDV